MFYMIRLFLGSILMVIYWGLVLLGFAGVIALILATT